MEKASVVMFLVGGPGGAGLTSDPFLTLLRPCGLVGRKTDRSKIKVWTKSNPRRGGSWSRSENRYGVSSVAVAGYGPEDESGC